MTSSPSDTSTALQNTRLTNLNRFYGILGELETTIGGVRKLADCVGHMNWPRRGVYFFFEQGENRSDSGDGPRVVRVGTHALRSGSKTKLWTRLSQHRGLLKTGGGNQRGSIFRKIVGAALITRDQLNYPTWSIKKGNRAMREAEVDLERKVSDFIRQMQFLWLAVEDEPGPNSQRDTLREMPLPF